MSEYKGSDKDGEEENRTMNERFENSVERIQTQLDNLIEVRRLCKLLEQKEDATVKIRDPQDCATIEVWAYADEPYPEMEELLNIGTRLFKKSKQDDIVYQPEDERFAIQRTYRVDG